MDEPEEGGQKRGDAERAARERGGNTRWRGRREEMTRGQQERTDWREQPIQGPNVSHERELIVAS